MLSRHLKVQGIAMLAAAAAACGSDGISFPDVSPSVLQQYCIRGQVAVDASGAGGTITSRSGTITDDDCNDGGNDGYYEGWHVRVTQRMTATLELTTTFDSWLEVLRVGDVNNPAATSTLIGEDDDSGEGLDARVTVTLEPDTDYVVFVSGYDDFETGTYALAIQ